MSDSASDAIIEAIARQLSECRDQMRWAQKDIARLEEEIEDHRDQIERFQKEEKELLAFIEEHGLKEAVEDRLPDD